MKPIGIVVGLAAEARVARRWGVPVVIGGGDAVGAARAVTGLAPQVRGLISFGLAGGLDPELRAGDLVVPERVVDGAESWDVDPGLMALLGGGTGHVIRGGGALLASIAEKSAARAEGADAVDLESAAVAREAAVHGLPFAVLRAICDDAGRDLPRAAVVALDNAGRIGALRVLGAVLRQPGDISRLMALGRDAGRARTALLGRVLATSGISNSP